MDTSTEEGNHVYEYSVGFHELKVNRNVLTRRLGYAKQSTPEFVSGIIDEVLASLPRYAAVRSGFRIIERGRVLFTPHGIDCGSIFFNTESIIAKRLASSSTIAVFVTTAGPLVEKWSRELMSKGDAVRGYIVDSAGSEVAEQAAEWLEAHVGTVVAPKNWNTTNRYSPGYCGWSVADQHKLFSLLPKDFCGIRLTESALMIPIKSVSGVIGLGPNAKKEGYQCSVCDVEDCLRRREESEEPIHS